MVMEDGEMVLSGIGSAVETAFKKSLKTVEEAAEADTSGGSSTQDASRKVLDEAQRLAMQTVDISASALKKVPEWGRNGQRTKDMEEDISL